VPVDSALTLPSFRNSSVGFRLIPLGWPAYVSRRLIQVTTLERVEPTMTMRRNINISTPGSYARQKKGRFHVMEQKRFSSRLAIAASASVLAAGLAMSSTSAASATTDTPNAPAVSAATVPTPTVSFSFAEQTVDSGTPPKLTYSGRNLPAGSEIFLQLAYGTPTQWDFVKSLNGTAGTATLQSVPAGLYDFRAVAEQGITVVAISPSRYLSVLQPSNSSCDACAILGSVAGAIVAWLLSLLP
jgi:hypothetical protein